MSKFGFKSNTVSGEFFKTGDRYVIDKQTISLKSFDLDADVLTGIGSGTDYVASGVYTFGWTNTLSGKASVAVTVPGNIPRDTKANLILSWCAISGVSAGTVPLNLSYRSVATRLSGVTVTGENYLVSGTHTITSGIHTLVSGISTDSYSTLQKTYISIPNTAIKPNNLLVLKIFRDSTDPTDTLTNTVRMLAVDLEYVHG